FIERADKNGRHKTNTYKLFADRTCHAYIFKIFDSFINRHAPDGCQYCCRWYYGRKSPWGSRACRGWNIHSCLHALCGDVAMDRYRWCYLIFPSNGKGDTEKGTIYIYILYFTYCGIYINHRCNGICFSSAAHLLLGANEETYPYAKDYLKIMLLF